jgi:ATP-dependent helicase/nuclease subunit A
VDEFQDTSRAQWALVELLVKSWASGLGLAARDLEPSIFIVGDRKQSIYGFRDAEVAVLDEAARYIEALRPIGQVRTAITRSFRAVRELLHFVNDVFDAVEKAPDRPDAFRYSEDDVFPLTSVEATSANALGLIAAQSDEQQAESVADEIARLLIGGAVVRDRETGVRRAVRPGDIAILFRTREGHRLFEDALARRRVPYYVYKGLGFFDADEIKDVLALLGFLARPESELHAAAFLRSRFIRVSDEALKLLAPQLAASLTAAAVPARWSELHPDDQVRMQLARSAVPEWVVLVDRLPPSELLDRILTEAAYAAELAGPAYRQARENLKKIRGLVRRLQNRGYATTGRIVDRFTQLVAGGDESNAIIDAIDAVNLMTTHAAKGLEFPVVFVVNLHRGSGGSPDPIRVFPSSFGSGEGAEPAVSIGEHESEGDRDAEARESEENKRLLYVALTRARDRLYLAATVNAEGRLAAGKGGLGRTLPPSLARLFTPALSSTEPRVTWEGRTAPHTFQVVEGSAESPTMSDSDPVPQAVLDDFTPLRADGARRVAATAVGSGAGPDARSLDSAGRSSIEAGVLVHRALDAGTDDLEPLLRDDERAEIVDVPRLLETAREALARIRMHPDVVELFGDGTSVVWRRHEVPFSWRAPDGAIVRGAFDCLVERVNGVVDVFEFKTGQPLAEHQRQLETYVAAAQALFPERTVQGRLIYSSHFETTFDR